MKATKIVIERAEGRTSECISVECTDERAFTTGYHGQGERRGYPVGTWACDVWTRANAILASWSHTAPKHGGYDKCDFKVTYEDGETYEGRYDLVNMSADKDGGYPSLERHMSAFLGCVSGRAKPGHMKEADYRRYLALYEADGTCKNAGEFLDAYEIGRQEKAA